MPMNEKTAQVYAQVTEHEFKSRDADKHLVVYDVTVAAAKPVTVEMVKKAIGGTAIVANRTRVGNADDDSNIWRIVSLIELGDGGAPLAAKMMNDGLVKINAQAWSFAKIGEMSAGCMLMIGVHLLEQKQNG